MPEINLYGGRLEYRYAPGDVCEIVDIEVPSEQRRTGVGRQMVDALCQMCKKRGVTTVYAITRTDNRIAQQFYENLRFSVSVLRDFYDPRAGKVDALLYSRSIDGPV